MIFDMSHRVRYTDHIVRLCRPETGPPTAIHDWHVSGYMTPVRARPTAISSSPPGAILGRMADDNTRIEDLASTVEEQALHDQALAPFAEDDPWIPPRNEDGTWPDSDTLCRMVRERTDTVILGFSMGKDSLAAYLQLVDHGFNVVPFHGYGIPGLEFQTRCLRYYERVMGRHIWRYPKPLFYQRVRRATMMPPHMLGAVYAADMPNLTYQHNYVSAMLDEDIEDRDPFVAMGVRAADSPIRRLTITQRGPGNWRQRTFFPCWDWNKARVMDRIRESGWKLPIDYRLFGRTYDGIDARYTWPLREHLPADYHRILTWFPLADTDLFRRGLIEGPDTDE